jgi:hypothetical protein
MQEVSPIVHSIDIRSANEEMCNISPKDYFLAMDSIMEEQAAILAAYVN